MLRINDIEDGLAISKALGIAYVPELHVVLARVTSEGNLMGGFIYTDYTNKAITLHMYGFEPGWMSHSILWVLFHFPFVELGVKKLIAPISSGNKVTMSIAHRLGFREAARIADVYTDGDLVLMMTTPETCRWFRPPPAILKKAA